MKIDLEALLTERLKGVVTISDFQNILVCALQAQEKIQQANGPSFENSLTALWTADRILDGSLVRSGADNETIRELLAVLVPRSLVTELSEQGVIPYRFAEGDTTDIPRLIATLVRLDNNGSFNVYDTLESLIAARPDEDYHSAIVGAINVETDAIALSDALHVLMDYDKINLNTLLEVQEKANILLPVWEKLFTGSPLRHFAGDLLHNQSVLLHLLGLVEDSRLPDYTYGICTTHTLRLMLAAHRNQASIQNWQETGQHVVSILRTVVQLAPMEALVNNNLLTDICSGPYAGINLQEELSVRLMRIREVSLLRHQTDDSIRWGNNYDYVEHQALNAVIPYLVKSNNPGLRREVLSAFPEKVLSCLSGEVGWSDLVKSVGNLTNIDAWLSSRPVELEELIGQWARSGKEDLRLKNLAPLAEPTKLGISKTWFKTLDKKRMRKSTGTYGFDTILKSLSGVDECEPQVLEWVYSLRGRVSSNATRIARHPNVSHKLLSRIAKRSDNAGAVARNILVLNANRVLAPAQTV